MTGATTTATAGSRPVPSARRLAWLAMAAVLAVAMLIGVSQGRQTVTPADRAQHLAEQIMCPKCNGQSVADSGSSAAAGIRQQINRRIADGASDDQIRDELAASYGERVILTPGRTGIASLVWTLPVAALVVAIVGLAFAFRRWRGQVEARASEADRALVDRALDKLHTG